MKRLPLGRLLRITIAVALTTILLLRSDPRAVLRVAMRADLPLIGAAVLLVLIDRALMAYRWVVLLTPLGPGRRPPLSVVMRIFFVSTFVGTFLPASVGGDAVRAYSLSRHSVGPSDAVASVLMDRLLGVFSILVLAILGLIGARELLGHRSVWLALAMTSAGCLAGALIVFSPGTATLAERLVARLPLMRHLTGATRGLVEAVQRYAAYRRELLNVLLCSLGVQGLRVLQAYCLGRALDIDASLVSYFAFVPLILLVMLLPVTINGIGTSQAAFIWFFGLVEVPSADAFALSVLFLGLGVVGNLPGGVLYAWGHGPPTKAR